MAASRRLTASDGQNRRGPHGSISPSETESSAKSAPNSFGDRSSNARPVERGGLYLVPNEDSSPQTAYTTRVRSSAGQKLPAPHPNEIPAPASPWISGSPNAPSGTSLNATVTWNGSAGTSYGVSVSMRSCAWCSPGGRVDESTVTVTVVLPPAGTTAGAGDVLSQGRSALQAGGSFDWATMISPVAWLTAHRLPEQSNSRPACALSPNAGDPAS